MNDQIHRIVEYINQQLSSGKSREEIDTQLLASGWTKEQIDLAHTQLTNPLATRSNQPNLNSQTLPPKDPLVNKHKVRNGVLWILSPYILLLGVAFLNIIVHFSLNSSTAGSPLFSALNIISVLGGLAGVILIPVGLIVGIIRLTKK
jgi:hypothetical protein